MTNGAAAVDRLLRKAACEVLRLLKECARSASPLAAFGRLSPFDRLRVRGSAFKSLSLSGRQRRPQAATDDRRQGLQTFPTACQSKMA